MSLFCCVRAEIQRCTKALAVAPMSTALTLCCANTSDIGCLFAGDMKKDMGPKKDQGPQGGETLHLSSCMVPICFSTWQSLTSHCLDVCMLFIKDWHESTSVTPSTLTLQCGTPLTLAACLQVT